MKKFLIASMVVANIGACHIASFAALPEGIEQLNSSKVSPGFATEQTQVKPKVKSTKILKKTRIKKTIPHQTKMLSIKIEKSHNDIDKMIEYNDFEKADKLLRCALNKNPKDIEAHSLWVVSLAKQYKLDPAQKQLDILLKTYPKNADLHYAQGIVDYKRTSSSNMEYIKNTPKLLNAALNEFNTAIALNKSDARYYNAAGVVEIGLGEMDKASALFSKAIELDPNYASAIDNSGTMDFVQGKYDDAEKKFKKALTINTDSINAMYHLAQIEDQRQNYSKALTYLNNALAINSNSYAVYNLAGELYKKQGNEAAAINAFKKSVMIKPEFSQPYLNLADIYEKRGDSEFALEQLKTALSVNPDFYDGRLKIADISLASGKYNQAIENYTSLLGKTDYNDAALKGLANAYFGQAQTASSKALIGSNQELFKAFDDLNKAIKANNEDLELHLAKLKLAQITNQPDLSKIELEKIIQTQNQDDTLVNTVIKGEAYLTLNDYQNAQKMFDKAIDSTTKLEDNLYLSEIFLYHKQLNSSKKVIQKILSEKPENQQALNDLDYISKCEKFADNYLTTAEFYLKTKNYSAASEYLSRSISLNPNNANAHLILAELLENQKNYKGATANYQAYLGLATNPKNKSKIERKIELLGKKAI